MRLAERIGRLERGQTRDGSKDTPADFGTLHDAQEHLRRFYEADPDAPAAWYREHMNVHVEQSHARRYGRAEEPSGPGRLLSNGLRTTG